MCTLILGRDVVAPGTLLVAANRDEDPARPSDPPVVLHEHPRIVGGRDRRAGGTWLAVREARAVIAILNRRADTAALPPDRRSRGALTLDVASVAEDDASPLGPDDEQALLACVPDGADPLARAALRRALAAIAGSAYAPFTLIYASAGAVWMVAHDLGRAPVCRAIRAGWHVVTHADLDDPQEPRTAWLVADLAAFRPRSIDDAEQRLGDLLRSHGGGGVPAVCLHDGRMVTVSSSMVWLAPGEIRYRHAEGRPCEHPFEDQRAVLALPAKLP